ncbi:cadherin-24 [Trichomycterus rosablanca]|uniref:cadherin-24 n=1 Tax=Trichomycterus rosablanca TaxID=2290929 RepID=UPI002F352031
MVEDEDKEWNPKERVGSRSRSRRSWIWNQFFVIEEYAGPEPVLIGRLHTDMDRGDGRTKYVLRGEGAGSVFVIDEKTGNIHVTKPLDREEKDEYRLIATATDSQTEHALEPSSQFIIRVQDINDNPPVFEDGPYSTTVSEMANIGTSIIQVTATDADDPTYGNSARLVYTLVQGQPHFSVDPQTGILRTAVPDLDRETQDQYLVVLQAKDMGGHLGGLSGTTTVTVKLTDVNDNPPHFIKSSWLFSVSELAAPGAEVGRISATDADLGENAKLEYTILEGESGNTFNITGERQEAIIILNKAVDYESRSSYSFSVEVLNPTVDPRFLRRGPFKDRALVRVAVLDADEPPHFSRIRYHMDVSENCPPECTVGRVSAVDPDTGISSNIRYSIDPQSDPEALFRITPDTGFITTTMELDREHEQWHNITIIATQRDNPSQVSRVVVAIETLDLNDNAPELDRQYSTAMCDSASVGQVVQVLRAIDKDEGGNDSTVHFNISPESSAALNFTIRESGGPTASLVLISPLHTLSRSSFSSLTFYVPLIIRDASSGLTSTGTVTVSVCPCLRGGAQAGEKEKQSHEEWDRETVCLLQQSSLPSPGLSTAALLAILACGATLLAVSALSLALRRQKRDSLSPLEEDDVRENIITYDDEGGGEADTAAFDITALQSAPHSAHRGYRTLDSRNIRYSQRGQDKSQTYSNWTQSAALDSGQYPSHAPLYSGLCYSSQTLPVVRRSQGPYESSLAELGYHFPGGQLDHSLVIQNKGAMVSTGALYMGPGERSYSSKEIATPQDGATISEEETPQKHDSKDDLGSNAQLSQDLNWAYVSVKALEAVFLLGKAESRRLILTHSDLLAPSHPQQVQSDLAPRELVLTRSGSLAQPVVSRGWVCDSAMIPETGWRSSHGQLSPKKNAVGSMDVTNGTNNTMPFLSCSYATFLQGEQQKDDIGSLGQGGLEMGSSFMMARSEGGIPLCIPEGKQLMNDWQDQKGLGGYGLVRRDMVPQLLPHPGQGRGAFSRILGYGGAWPTVHEAVGRNRPRGGSQSLALRVGEFLRLRLAQVTFDPTQPPYDSVQVYGLEGTGSRAGSLSSLESEGDKEANIEEWGGALEDWGPRFHKLAQLFQEREKEDKTEKEKGKAKEVAQKQNDKKKEEKEE